MEICVESEGNTVMIEVSEDDTVLSVKEKVCRTLALGVVDSFDLWVNGAPLEDCSAVGVSSGEPLSPTTHMAPIGSVSKANVTSTSSTITHCSSSSAAISETTLSQSDTVQIRKVGYPTHESAVINMLDEGPRALRGAPRVGEAAISAIAPDVTAAATTTTPATGEGEGAGAVEACSAEEAEEVEEEDLVPEAFDSETTTSDYTCDEMSGYESEQLRFSFSASASCPGRLVVARTKAVASQRVFCTDTGKLLMHLHPPMMVSCVVCTPDGFILSAASDNLIHIWDGKDGSKHPANIVLGTPTLAISSMEVSECGEYLAVHGGTELRVYDITRLPFHYPKLLKVQAAASPMLVTRLHGMPCVFAGDVEGRKVKCWSLGDQSVLTEFEVLTQEELEIAAARPPSIHVPHCPPQRKPTLCCVSEAAQYNMQHHGPNGPSDHSSFIVCAKNDTLTVFCSQGRRICSITSPEGVFQQLALSECGGYITALQGNGSLMTYRYMLDGSLSCLYARDRCLFNSFCTSKCGSFVVACEEDRVDVFRVDLEEPFRTFCVSMPCSDPYYESCHAMADGKYAVVTEEDKVFIFK